jgi:hypothetical protein
MQGSPVTGPNEHDTLLIAIIRDAARLRLLDDVLIAVVADSVTNTPPAQ